MQCSASTGCVRRHRSILSALIVVSFFVLVCPDINAQETGQTGASEELPAPSIIRDLYIDDIAAPCAPDEDNRRSDLCAQWKAADAASVSALWTKWSVLLDGIGLAAGLITVVAAGFAAWYARKAAIYAGRSAEEAGRAVQSAVEANSITRLQARAWVAIDCHIQVSTHSQQKNNPINWDLICTMRNVGDTPALNITMATRVGFLGAHHPHPYEWVNNLTEECRSTPPYAAKVLFPDCSTQESRNLSLKADELAAESKYSNYLHPFVYGCINYNITGGGSQICQTSFAFLVLRSSNTHSGAIDTREVDWAQKPVVLSIPLVMMAN